MGVAVSFAKDISPLFTGTDVTCMGRFGVRLKDYAYMSTPGYAANVLGHLDGSVEPQMPPGEPWQQAQITLFKDWIACGYQP